MIWKMTILDEVDYIEIEPAQQLDNMMFGLGFSFENIGTEAGPDHETHQLIMKYLQEFYLGGKKGFIIKGTIG